MAGDSDDSSSLQLLVEEASAWFLGPQSHIPFVQVRYAVSVTTRGAGCWNIILLDTLISIPLISSSYTHAQSSDTLVTE